MNILFVSCKFRLFDSLDCGASHRSTMLVKALSEIGHVDVISFCKDPVLSNITNCDVIYNTYLPQLSSSDNNSILKRGINLLKLFFTPWNPLCYYRENKQRKEVVSNYFNKKKYDIVVCRYIDEAISCGLLKYAEKLIVDVDDSLVSASKRDISNMDFYHFWSKPIAVWKANAIGIMQKCFLRNIKCSFYSNVLESPYKESIYLHNVTTVTSTPTEITSSTPKRLLVVGWLDFFPNKEGVRHFVKNVFPVIRSEIHEAELHVVGKTHDAGFMKWLNGIEGIKALGYVENIVEEYRECSVIIIPVYHGSGTSVKFIEGMMMNRPMVSTPMGVRGFESICLADKHYMLAKTDKEFAEKTIRLLSSIDISNNMARLAYKVGTSYFSQEHFIETVKKAIG